MQAALTTQVILEMSVPSKLNLPNRTFTVDYPDITKPKTAQTYFFNLTELGQSTPVPRAITRTFRLTSKSMAGYDPTADAAFKQVVIDRPCSARCPVELLDDIFESCEEKWIAVQRVDEACPAVNDTAVAATFCNTVYNASVNGSSAYPTPLTQRTSRRRALLEHEMSLHASTFRAVSTGRILMQSPSSFGSALPEFEPPNANWTITEPLPVEPALMVAAERAPRPRENSVVKEGAEARLRPFRQPDLDTVDPSSDLGRLMATHAKNVKEFAFRPYNPNFTIPDYALVDISNSSCPPDHKIPVLSLGRTEIASLCEYKVRGKTTVCMRHSAYAVQFLFNATTTGLYRFSTTASAFATVIDVKNEGCFSHACSGPVRLDSAHDAAAETSVFALLLEGSQTAVNVAAFDGGCGSGKVVLQIDHVTPYDDHVFVDEELQFNETVPNPFVPISATGPAPSAAVFSSIDRAIAYALKKVGTSTAGRPVQVGVFLKGGNYLKNETSIWAPPEPLAGADGSTVILRSYSAGMQGPHSATDTVIICNNGAKGMLTLSHASPLVVPLGITVAACGGNVTQTRKDGQGDPSRSTAAITLRGPTVSASIKNVLFLKNENPHGPGPRLPYACLWEVELKLKGPSMYRRRAGDFGGRSGNGCPTCPEGGALAVMGQSSATVVNSTFAENHAVAGGAVVVGHPLVPAHSVSFDTCVFKVR
eukprot:tig00020562_g11144.t1